MRRAWGLASLAVAGWLAGCSPAQYMAQPASVEETRNTVRELKAEQAALAKRIEAIEKLLASQDGRLTRINADLNAQLGTLSENLQQISGRLDDMTGQIQRRGRALPPPSLYPEPLTPGTEPAGADTAAGSGTPGFPGASGGGSATASPSQIDPEQVYDHAYRDVTRGSYDLAISGFREFLRLFPDHSLSDNAQYWLGECYYVQNDIPRAMEEFRKVLDKYPDGDKTPAAYLKLGYCSLRENQTTDARRYFEDLIRKYPTSEEARSARGKLATLD